MPAWFYLLRLRSGALYPGATTQPAERYDAHCRGTACRTTRLDPPVGLAYSEEKATFPEARRREAQVKKWTRAKKEALARGDAVALRRLPVSRD
jgi:predicted GIY-YIG superfamily endonuclease